MNLGWLVTNLVAALLLPPLNLLVLSAWGAWLTRSRRRQRLGRALIWLSVAGLWLLSTPYLAGLMLDALKPPYRPITGDQADAIVILGGGVQRGNLEYGGDTVGRLTLERVRYGAWLARETGKPVLVTGGAPEGGEAEGHLMRAVLEREFGIPVRWVEDRAANTRENALHSAELLEAAGARRIFLVTHAWHLKRAIPEFERAGLVVIPAGIGYSAPESQNVLDFLPSARGLRDSYYAMHEGIGLIWYRIRNQF
ncbi:MAG: YdcF family protein [Thiobacillaceae bacterium]